jgi:hypothetical protein
MMMMRMMIMTMMTDDYSTVTVKGSILSTWLGNAA